MINAVVAIDSKRGIGKDGKIPWFIKGEQLRLKQITMSHPVIMGRKTYESIPQRFRPLTGRENIIITRDTHWNPHEQIHIVHNIDEAINLAISFDPEIFILGGAQIYNETINRVDRLYLTIITGDYNADTFFPDYSKFNTIISQENRSQDGIKFQYITLEKPHQE